MSKNLNCPFCGSDYVEDTEYNRFACSNESCTASELWFDYDEWHNRKLPEGMALVPVEPSREMVLASGAINADFIAKWQAMNIDIYKEMINEAKKT